MIKRAIAAVAARLKSLPAKLIALGKKEPAAVGTGINIAISTASKFGFQLTADQTFMVFLLASALLGVGIRQAVTPNSKVPPAPPGGLPGH